MLKIEDNETDAAVFKVNFTPDGASVSFYYRMDDQTPDEYVQEYLTIVHGIVSVISTDTDYLYKMGEVVNFGRALMHQEQQEQDVADVSTADLSNVTFHPSLKTRH